MLNLNIVNISINKIFNKILLIIRVSFFFYIFLFTSQVLYVYIFYSNLSNDIPIFPLAQVAVFLSRSFEGSSRHKKLLASGHQPHNSTLLLH